MNTYIIIPVKEKSKRLPGKNWGRMLGGMSLLERAVKTAKATGATVLVSTSSQLLLGEAKRLGVRGAYRSPETNEWDLFDVVRHVIGTAGIEADARVVLLQCTNPFVTRVHLMKALEMHVPVMGVAEAGAFYARPVAGWNDKSFDDRDEFAQILISPSVDIDTPDDFNKAKELMR